MELRQLENFIEVCRQMSITKAANNMYITQQGMSKSIRSLETELGVPLFIRTANTLVPTEYGRVLLKYAEQIDNLYLQSLYEISNIKASGSVNLNIGIPHGLVNIMPRSCFLKFMENHPDISLSMEEYDDEVLDEAVRNGTLDIGFCVEPVSREGITVHASQTYKTFYMLAENHPLAREESIDLRLLKDENFIGFGEGNKGHKQLAERCLRAGFTPKIGIHSNDMELIRQMCRMGLGIGFFVGDANTKLPGLSIVPDKVPNWNHTICLCTSSSKCLSAAEHAFLEDFSRW